MLEFSSFDQAKIIRFITGAHILVVFSVLALACPAFASDPSPLQDFCVALNDTEAAVDSNFYDGIELPSSLMDATTRTKHIVHESLITSIHNWAALCLGKAQNFDTGSFVNGKFCKDPKQATADDFFLAGLHIPGNTSNPIGSRVTTVNVNQIAGVNTLGISMVRIDYAPYGLNPPHIHPRATEILVVLEGTLYVGFVTSNPENRLITKVLNKGDIFVFPIGLIHFQFNSGNPNAVVFAALSSQNPGVITIANAVFGSTPPIKDDVLAKAFQVDQKVVDYLQAQFWMDNN